jgi:predicted ATPase/DNA-binding CsgD family transcriptional regulator
MEVEDWLDIHRRRRDGVPIRQIAREKSLSRNTVRRALAGDTPPAARTRPSPGSAIDAYEPQIIELLLQDPAIATAAIGRRIGWTRSHTVLKDRVRGLRAQVAHERRERERPPEGSTLPADFTSFVGRRDELAHLRGLLGAARLVSLAGPGGVGKTRLAIRAAAAIRDRFTDGTWMVQLDALGDPALVAQSLLDGLGIADPSRSTGDPIPRLVEHLKRRRALLVLDNCEHLIEGVAPLLTVLLQRAPGLTVLLTSRQPLGIAGEQVVLVAPLELPPAEGPLDLGAALASPAVALFADRAAAALPGFAVTDANYQLVAQVCRALEGIPLAIELATVRLRALSLAELLEHLDHRFTVLTDGSPTAPARQRTLQATIGWSFELCTDHERALWTRSSVFAGGFDIAAATAVCADERLPAHSVVDAVGGLVAKSILVRDEHAGRLRFRMLETIREFGHAQLPPHEHPDVRARHLDWCLRLVTDCTSHWFGPDQILWTQRMRREQGNLRSALEHALDPSAGDSTAAQRLVGLPWFLWATAFSFTEHRRWLHRALDASSAPTPERVQALATCGFVACAQGDQPTARALSAESLHLARTLDLPTATAFATHILGLVALFSGQADQAAALLYNALERYGTLGMPEHVLGALQIHLGMLHLSRAELEQAEAHLQALHARCVSQGETWERAYATDGLGFIALARGDLDGATSAAREGLRLAAAFDDTVGLAFAIDLTAWTAAAHDEPGRAAILLGAASSLWGSFGQQLYGSLFWQEWRERHSTAARAALGPAAFDSAHLHGASLSRPELVRLALEPAGREPPQAPSTSPLSPRELEIAELVAHGHTNREIAERLFLSHRTVEGHVSRALDKLDLHRRSQLAAWIANHPVGT